MRWVRGKPVWNFVGVQQYFDVLNDSLFKAGILNTIVFSVVAVTRNNKLEAAHFDVQSGAALL